MDRLAEVRAVAGRVARTLGLEIFDVQLRRESIGWVLRIVIDRAPGVGSAAAVGSLAETPRGTGEIAESVSVEDCQRVSRDVAAILDVEDLFDHPYTLEVSSPGLDRPLRDVDDFRRFTGRLAKIVVAPAVDGQRHFSGRLRGVDEGSVVMEGHGGRLHRIPLAAIARARLEVEF